MEEPIPAKQSIPLEASVRTSRSQSKVCSIDFACYLSFFTWLSRFFFEVKCYWFMKCLHVWLESKTYEEILHDWEERSNFHLRVRSISWFRQCFHTCYFCYSFLLSSEILLDVSIIVLRLRWWIHKNPVLWAAPPKITPFEFVQGLKAGDKTALICSSSGSSPLKFQWLKNGADVKEDDSTKVIKDEDLSAIKFKSLRSTDSGDYECRVSNNEGVDSFSARLAIKGKHMIPLSSRYWL